jgi:hypothetical protein
MTIKNRAIIIFFFLFLPLFGVNAIMARELAVNDSLKECRTFQPTGSNDLPNGWKIHDFPDSSSSLTHKSECERIGYGFVSDELNGQTNYHSPYMIATIILNILFLVAFISLLVNYLKTRKKIIIIALLFAILMYLFFYLASRFSIG